uniref:Saposin B-type domain-containing protein n=1 Tax=Strongyloides stercoralis TaxID=6248 RepID=A0A0K0EGL3_STRER
MSTKINYKIILLTILIKIVFSNSNKIEIFGVNSEEGSLMLGCIICKQLLNYISIFYQIGMNKNSIKDSIQANYCNDLGLFTNICTKTLDAYYNDLWKDSINVTISSNMEKCQNIGLCPTTTQLDACSSNFELKYANNKNMFIKKKKYREEL